MESTRVIDEAEFWLPQDFLTDDDFLVEKDNNGDGIDEINECLYPYEPTPTVNPKIDAEIFLAGLTRRMVHPTLEDELSGGLCGGHAFPAANGDKAWGMTRSPQSTTCGVGIGCGCRNQNRQSRVSSKAAWDLYCAAVDEIASLNISDEPYGYSNRTSRGLSDLPGKQSISAAKTQNNGTGYFNRRSLPYQKLQAIQFQQLKQQQLLKNHRRLVQQSRGVKVTTNKNGGPVGSLSPSAWSNQLPRRDDSCMRGVFVGDLPEKRSSTGTGVFIPRQVSRSSSATAEKHTDSSWRQPSLSNDGGFFSRQIHGGVKAEQSVNEPRLPSDWTY